MDISHIVSSRLADLSQRGDSVEAAAGIVERDIADIVDEFYARLSSIPEAARFLNRRVVEDRLRPALSNWLVRLFSVRSQEGADRFIQWHRGIGATHARVHVPMYLVLVAGQELRSLLASRILKNFQSSEAGDILLVVSELVDSALLCISNAYVQDALRAEREAQSFVDSLAGRDLAVECERARAALYDWARKASEALLVGDRRSLDAIALRHSSFGTWLFDKAQILVSDPMVIRALETQATALDAAIDSFLTDPTRDESPQVLVTEIGHAVDSIASGLTKLSQHVMSLEIGRDPLTRLQNRRFLPAVLHREIELADVQGSLFAVAILDVDHFKSINDTHGHPVGDLVLQHLARLLLEHVRSSDFVFRYGGEEFLLIYANVDAEEALGLVEKLRMVIAESPALLEPKPVKVTVSIGVSLYDRHPDPRLLIERADRALYEAKRAGRNRSVMAP